MEGKTMGYENESDGDAMIADNTPEKSDEDAKESECLDDDK